MQKSHPREWVDVSVPTYQMRARPSENPTHGSGWIVQIQPLNNPPTPVGGIPELSEGLCPVVLIGF